MSGREPLQMCGELENPPNAGASLSAIGLRIGGGKPHRCRPDQRGQYMVRRRVPPPQGWRTFLRNHADGIGALDLFVVPAISFRLQVKLRNSSDEIKRESDFGDQPLRRRPNDT
jgi:hypothetical protein